MTFPQLYFSENEKSKEYRDNFIKNSKTNSCNNTNELLKTCFFSDENIDLINKKLILTVFDISNKIFKIGQQSKSSLLIVMQCIFIEHSLNLPTNIKEQIINLNCRVVNDILPRILTELNQRIDYLNKINNPRKLLSLPENVKTSKTLQSVSTILF